MTRKSPKNNKPGGRKPLSPRPARGIPQRERRGDPVEGKGGGPRAKRPRPAGKRPEKIGDRVAKVIARAGLGSRREAETWIAEGRVAINGAVIASPAVNV